MSERDPPGHGAGIAVVGLACRVPGAQSPQELWRLLLDGRRADGRAPDGRFDPSAIPPGLRQQSVQGSYLGDVARFDAELFVIPEREATTMDPHQRWALELGWAALEDAARPGAPTVEFQAVTFGYEPDRPVLRELSFSAAPGTLTALVGPSGAGKSTVLSLLARFYDLAPGEGTVLVGGRDIRHLGTETLMRQLSLVSQDPYLFEDTIENNIALARPGASRDELERVARLARVDEIIQRLPDGWETRVGEGGSTLSGGEEQRVSIARALLKDAPIVLLDEVTSSLDAQNERLVQQAITQLAEDRTVLVVAHRLQTVRGADHIIVLDEGRMTESGTHTALLEHNGTYRRFVELREQADSWTLTPR
ncbi:ATP-binding cassette domain-containing protein [Streptomyces albipurpureus]|uniref:ATP-binding cassette domain-containing protein n=1 Tax=Streptomyces albipurpureus TaxID=2897419 RepID=A0ABT0UJR8_9ACTN|nr:ATP-binding cassette domain-containing protein [Streptomyces sp. CWNU-1]MCM2388254.1 ATP-binding cassette domain-containing protein [Streptomyces sp. CWNU-1]